MIHHQIRSWRKINSRRCTQKRKIRTKSFTSFFADIGIFVEFPTMRFRRDIFAVSFSVAVTSLIVVTSVVGLFANALVIVAVLGDRKLRSNPMALLLANLVSEAHHGTSRVWALIEGQSPNRLAWGHKKCTETTTTTSFISSVPLKRTNR